MGVRTYLNGLAANRVDLIIMWWQSNCSGTGPIVDFDPKYVAPPSTYIRHNGVVAPYQMGVNNKISPNENAGYDGPVAYTLQSLTGREVYIAKVDYGGTQIAKDTGSASSSNVAIGTGTKSFTIGTGLTYAQDDKIIAASASGYMRGLCTGYNSATGLISINSTLTSGSGSSSSWTVGKLDWNSASVNEFYDEIMTEAKAMITYLFQNNKQFRITIFPIGGEEDGLVTANANAFDTNTETALRKMENDLHNYIYTNHPGNIIPDIKTLINETPSNSGTNGDTVRTAIETIVQRKPLHRAKIIKTVQTPLQADNVHLTSAAYTAGGIYGANKIYNFWN
jgi:hypothetical protein